MNYELRIKDGASAKRGREERVHNSLFLIRNSRARGYTMIELLVTITIIGLIAAIVLSNYPRMSEQLSVSRTAQEVALSLREAKTYALAVRQFCPVGGGLCTYQIGYGAHFDLATPADYLVFAAASAQSGGYVKTYYGPDWDIDKFNIKAGTIISKICGGIKTAPPGDCNFDKVDIVYSRPDPSVNITGFYSGGTTALVDVGLVIKTPGGQERTVVVWNTGQITVEQ
jgi:prepilin-type N-terminal cleavage/methylation domain-containing protein